MDEFCELNPLNVQRSATGVPISHRAVCVQAMVHSEVIRVLVPTSTCRSSTAVEVSCLLILNDRSSWSQNTHYIWR